MYFSRASVLSALLGLGAATTHSVPSSESSMSGGSMSGGSMSGGSMSGGSMSGGSMSGGSMAGMVATHVIQVGGANGSLTFSPENVKAAAGDLVQFQFHPKNHSVVQSTFDQPCVPIQNVNPNVTTAFFSGYMPTNASVGAKSNVLTYTIRVMDTKPVWFYCSQGKHCQAGMVGAINAAETGNKTMSAFKALAAKAAANITPGGSASGGTGSGSASPSGGSGTGTGGGAAASSGAAGGAGGAAGGAGGAGGAATSTSANSPAQQTTNAAPGLKDAAKQSMFGLSVGALAAFLVL